MQLEKPAVTFSFDFYREAITENLSLSWSLLPSSHTALIPQKGICRG